MDLGCPWRHLQKIHLQVVYPVFRKHSSAPLVPRLNLVSTTELKTLFSVDDVKLPSWVDGMDDLNTSDFFKCVKTCVVSISLYLPDRCMVEYLPYLEQCLHGRIMEAVSSIDVRRLFIEALGTVFGRLIETNPVFCRKATVVMTSGVLAFLVHFHISTQFPKQQAALVLQNSQHFNSQGAPIQSSLIADYPWSPIWEPSQMAERIFDFLVGESLNFKRYCTEA